MKAEKIMVLYNAFLASAGVITDSRKNVRNSMFFALTGCNFDGNSFAPEALKDGASFAVVSAGSVIGKDILADRNVPMKDKYIVVEDVLDALQSLAAYHRSRFSIPVIALTGTNGKTTTKELICAVLSRKYRVAATAGNLNNHIGVPLTLLGMNSETEIAVIEMGANHIGEIEKLVNIASPDFGLVTNVGIAHLEGFGSFENVKKAKGELYDFFLKKGKPVIYNADSEDLCKMIELRAGIRAMKYGVDYQKADILSVTEEEPFLRMMIPLRLKPGCHYENDRNMEKSGKILLKTHLAGNYNSDNVLAALNTGVYFGIPLDEAIEAVSSYIPLNHRSQLADTGRNILLLDAYNANPSSMKTALSNFENGRFKNKMLILGDMLELGKNSEAEHLKIINQVSEMKFMKCFFVGEEFYNISKNVTQGDNFAFFHNVEELKRKFMKEQPQGYTFFVKGSNGIRLSILKDVL